MSESIEDKSWFLGRVRKCANLGKELFLNLLNSNFTLEWLIWSTQFSFALGLSSFHVENSVSKFLGHFACNKGLSRELLTRNDSI